MTPNSTMLRTELRSHPTSAWYERWFAGLTWKGLAIVAVLCLINALRRHATILLRDDFAAVQWVMDLLVLCCTGLVAMLVTTLAAVATYNRVSAAPWIRYPALALSIVCGSAVGIASLMAIESSLGLYDLAAEETHEGSLFLAFIAVWPRYAVPGALIASVFVFFRVRTESEEATRKAELDRARMDQQMQEARLQVLQAQIEPHFLFNTLANVRRLYQTNRPAGESMLENLMRYLTVALPSMRAVHSTLGCEADLTASYLEIQRIRMGRRLTFDIDVPQALRGAPLPSMMLLTLAENAIKHGLNPLAKGGSVRVSARVEERQLRVQVADTGRGFTRTRGGGAGLANIRARLGTMYGASAELRIESNLPSGVIATIALPYPASAPAASLP